MFKVSKRYITSFLLLALFIIILIIAYPLNANVLYKNNYVILSICLLIILLLLNGLYIKGKLDFFEPLTVVSLIYLFMFFITPIYDIVIKNYYWYGYNLFVYGIKSTIIAFIGYLIFFIFYRIDFLHFHFIKKNYKHFYKKNLIWLVFLIYGFSLVCNIYYMIQKGGYDLTYLLTLGMLGKSNMGSTTESSIGYISMFSYCLPAATLLYWEFGNNKLIKIILFVPMMILQIARGFRFFIIQIAITFFAYYYIKRNERPKLQTIVLFLCLLLIPIIIMTMFRSNIRAGAGINFNIINLDSIIESLDDAFWGNFRIYRNYYGIIGNIPSNYSYMYFEQIIFGTLSMVIPRAIWPNKPNSFGIGLDKIIGNNLANTGQAYPGLGEYYYSFGLVGIFFFMTVYAIWMKKVKKKVMYYNTSNIDIIEFSILLGTNLQLLIRGYTPSNFWYVVFSLLPVYIIRLYLKIR